MHDYNLDGGHFSRDARGGTWKSRIAAFLFLFLLLGLILIPNALDARLVSVNYFFTAILKMTCRNTKFALFCDQ